MYKVSNQLTSAYGSDMDFKAKQGPEMPHVTVSNRRMTNVPMGNGDFVQGIRRNPEEQVFGGVTLAGDALEAPRVRPLRYTPGLKCDAHLESLRPERDGRHPAIQGGEDWKRKLVQSPQTFDGSFVDADMQRFRPSPMPNPNEDPWYASRLPDQTMPAMDRLAMPTPMCYPMEMQMAGPYGQMYPQDELSRIKMRNRRFMNACAQDMYLSNMGIMGPQPVMSMRPPSIDYEAAQDELSMLDQELNMTRRANRPFVPVHHQDYYALQRQVQDMEQPIETPRRPVAEPTSVEQLPLPKRTVKASTTDCGTVASNRPEVRIADQIAIRSFVLGQNLPRIGGSKPAAAESS